MPRRSSLSLVAAARIENCIYLIRGQKVLLSNDLAKLYGVPVKRLNEAVKRNLERFPPDFMFAISRQEYANLKSQIATSSWGGARRALPYAFTEEGVAMLSAVLRSETAVAVSIQIMRVFVRLRRMLASYEPLRRKLGDLERQLADHDHQIAVVFDAIRQLMEEPEGPVKPRIGFETEAIGE